MSRHLGAPHDKVYSCLRGAVARGTSIPQYDVVEEMEILPNCERPMFYQSVLV